MLEAIGDDLLDLADGDAWLNAALAVTA